VIDRPIFGNLGFPVQPRHSPPLTLAPLSRPQGVCKGGQEHRLRLWEADLVCAPNPRFCGLQPDPGRARRTLPAVDHPRHPNGSVARPRAREGARALYRALPPLEEERGREGRGGYAHGEPQIFFRIGHKATGDFFFVSAEQDRCPSCRERLPTESEPRP
jgi:hypothetical protein